MGFTYTNSIPQPGDFPSTSQDQFLQNYEYLKTFSSRDHEFTQLSTTANDGTHKKVTFNNIVGAHTFTGANSLLYADTAQGQSQLFFTNAAIDAQLVCFKANVPTNATNGVSCLPGGLIIVWGTNAAVNDNGTIDFSALVTLSASCYTVTATLEGSAGPRGFLNIYNKTATSFQISSKDTGGSGALNNCLVNWIAIGPA